jgi:hypothetical protein
LHRVGDRQRVLRSLSFFSRCPYRSGLRGLAVECFSFLLWLATRLPRPSRGQSSLATFVLTAIACLTAGCSQPNRDPSTITFLIEFNPTDLDPRIDALTDQIRVEMNQEKRKALCSEVPKTPDEDLLTRNLADFNPTKR